MTESQPPVELHSTRCAACKKPILPGTHYAEVNLPDGNTVPVHLECMDRKKGDS